jgi:gamma-glutamylcyclotransferase (GGCT)/AIG2-like uncharacterized protein YtfP
MSEPIKVFVYGSLRRGFRLHGHLTRSRFVAMVDDESARTAGEIWEVSRSTLEALDVVEGYREDQDKGLYLRRLVQAQDEEGNRVDVHTYFGNMPLDRVPRVRTGKVDDWAQWTRQKLSLSTASGMRHEDG